ncbi:Glutathione S-transferase [Hibiscus syriacus]|uniref:glutathione transferase n=1 Tax=Hibiscus syriacus TaxID=106335 RepID=A0A6A2YMF7_HIBSY|nr:Glutathione S-transferase [Hibiscus syriacus]
MKNLILWVWMSLGLVALKPTLSLLLWGFLILTELKPWVFRRDMLCWYNSVSIEILTNRFQFIHFRFSCQADNTSALGVDFQCAPINTAAGEHKSDNFLAVNPFGQVPAFEDGYLKLFESRAITHYVAHEYAGKGTQLLNTDSNKEAAVLTLWQEAIVAAKVEENEAKLGKVLDVYETRLSQSKYLASDHFTLVDLLMNGFDYNAYSRVTTSTII